MTVADLWPAACERHRVWFEPRLGDGSRGHLLGVLCEQVLTAVAVEDRADQLIAVERAGFVVRWMLSGLPDLSPGTFPPADPPTTPPVVMLLRALGSIGDAHTNDDGRPLRDCGTFLFHFWTHQHTAPR